ncbi:uncharacterized protein LOC121250596 [Juglans microcarpa x Juglans regia]|uniref:uncharacterized protein LOC121250596 n=1 Tax=Juglans microcarpa x Juglans regia TaxID=2249226 RepID=UPI001B7DD377|nr:uncharacterized protein LOC121250596 [Juglans microcarpa x Juglans regia]
MRGILCRHILAVFKANGIKSLPDRYILDRWRKDIKQRYTLIPNSYDEGDQRPNGNRYSILLNMCYGMITYAADSNEQFEDVKKRIHEMTECYCEQTCNLSLTQTGSNVGFETLDTAAVGSSQQVKSPLVVKGKRRPPSLRRASRMETELRKVKSKKKKAPKVRGKLKQRDEGDTSEGDTPAMGTHRNLFGPSEVDIINSDLDSLAFDCSGTQHRETLIGIQESVTFLNFA